MTFLQVIISVLLLSILCFLVTIIVLANRRKFFRVITLNTLIFIFYCFIAYHYEVIFNNDLFGKGRVIFLLSCVFIHSLISMIIVIKSEKSNFFLNNKERNQTTTPQKKSNNLKDD